MKNIEIIVHLDQICINFPMKYVFDRDMNGRIFIEHDGQLLTIWNSDVWEYNSRVNDDAEIVNQSIICKNIDRLSTHHFGRLLKKFDDRQWEFEIDSTFVYNDLFYMLGRIDGMKYAESHKNANASLKNFNESFKKLLEIQSACIKNNKELIETIKEMKND